MNIGMPGRALTRIVSALVVSVISLCASIANGEPVAASDASAPVHLPETTVIGTVPDEERLVGPYQQPEWTLHRQFGETRVYVLPPWVLSLQTSWNAVDQRGQDEGEAGDTSEHSGASFGNELTQEVELGLPYRFQIDYEARGGNTDPDGDWRFLSQSIELRWALADWDVIPLNPTLFAEWKFRNAEADSFELKTLFGDELAPRVNWALNLFFEQQVGDDREQEVAASQALNYVLSKSISLGAEMKFSAESQLVGDEDERKHREYEYKFELGPALQWRPIEPMFINVVPLFGVTTSAPVVDAFVIVGFNWGGEPEHEIYEPASLRMR